MEVIKMFVDTKTVLGAKIYYTVDDGHPDWWCMTDKEKYEVNTFEDTYIFDNNWYAKDEVDAMIEHAKWDLALVAGGGYDTDHIHNIRYEFILEKC